MLNVEDLHFKALPWCQKWSHWFIYSSRCFIYLSSLFPHQLTRWQCAPVITEHYITELKTCMEIYPPVGPTLASCSVNEEEHNDRTFSTSLNVSVTSVWQKKKKKMVWMSLSREETKKPCWLRIQVWIISERGQKFSHPSCVAAGKRVMRWWSWLTRYISCSSWPHCRRGQWLNWGFINWNCALKACSMALLSWNQQSCYTGLVRKVKTRNEVMLFH